MIFKYGSYAHDQDTVMVRTTNHGIFDRFNRRMGDMLEYTLIGFVQVADDPDPEVTKAALTTKIDGLIAAYDVDYQDFGLYHDDGTTPTRHVVTNAETFGGTKVVVAPSFMNGPWGGRVEYTNRRSFHIVLRAEIRVGTGLYSWKDKLTIRGTGGPKWRYSPKLSGAPDGQILQTATSFWYVQEGEAIGREDYPDPPDPMFPSIEHEEMRVRAFTSAEDMVVDGQEMFGTSWQYFMEATTDQGLDPFDIPSIGAL